MVIFLQNMFPSRTLRRHNHHTHTQTTPRRARGTSKSRRTNLICEFIMGVPNTSTQCLLISSSHPSCCKSLSYYIHSNKYSTETEMLWQEGKGCMFHGCCSTIHIYKQEVHHRVEFLLKITSDTNSLGIFCGWTCYQISQLERT